MRITALYHVSFEKLGYVEDWIIQKGHALSEIYLYKEQAMPKVEDFDLLVIMGGPMSANDDAILPWLGPEIALIRRAIQTGKSILGICLGAQLIAKALGSKVYQGKEKEIGWFPVSFTGDPVIRTLISGMPEEMTVFHWHGETFDLPAGADRLAKSEVTPNQAFVYNKHVLGVQFHIEMKPDNISLMINNAGEELIPSAYIQSASDLSKGLVHVPANKDLLSAWLNYLEDCVIQHNRSVNVN